ncbi:nucleolar RNA helicase 2-like isoform X2 [Tubulanus polymorphus]|uniref:nucleolar RNA helicase 2-like isoform X2 n=1 Tax=Tubulanus polymorphus TaxID=672921 RepID=UPI003DA25962
MPAISDIKPIEEVNMGTKEEKKAKKHKKSKKEKKDKSKPIVKEEKAENGEVSQISTDDVPEEVDLKENVEITKKKLKKEKSPPRVLKRVQEAVVDEEVVASGDFSKFEILDSVVNKLKARGIAYLFPVQSKTYNQIYSGKDVVAQARTGTGKTFSFAIPLVCHLEKLNDTARGRAPKALVMAPTRELAKQVGNDFDSLSSKVKSYCIYGGVPYEPQMQAMRNGLDVLVGTPGRIYDYIERGTFDVTKLKYIVLDEVDQMLDMGFAEIVDKIISGAYSKDQPEMNPQTLLFSATMPSWVRKTASKYMRDDMIQIDLIGQDRVKTATTVQHLAIKCNYQDRPAAIGDVIQVYSGNHGRAMVFCETKRDCDELACDSAIKQDVHVLHGDIKQSKREMVLKKFREGHYRCLVTTNVAARGLDIPEVDLVIQCQPPSDVDSYIHRSGRTGRAGRGGVCICFYKPFEDYALSEVERKAGITFKKIGVPTKEDIIHASSEDVVRSLDDVKEKAYSHFFESADKLIETKGARTALAAALALLTGNTSIAHRSLITSKEGFTTFLFETESEMRGLGYCWSAIERQLGADHRDNSIHNMRMCADKKGCVFDVPTSIQAEFEDQWEDTKWDSLSVATELPELVERAPARGGGGHFNRNRGGGGRRGGGGFHRNNNGSFKRRQFDDFVDNNKNKRMRFDD